MRRAVRLLLFATLLPVAPVIAQVDSEQLEIDWSTNAADYRGQFRKAFNVYCPPSGRSATVWGDNIYTDDSSICTAAVHALATFDFARGGTVYFAMEPGQEGYGAEHRHGVTTQTWTNFWDGSFRIVAGIPGKKQSELNDSTPAEITWATSARFLRGDIGAKHVLLCPSGGDAQLVWGSDIYTDDSSICSAAVHAGLITPANGGGITLQTGGARENFVALNRNGITSKPWERWDGSFSLPRGQRIVALPVPAPMPAEVDPARASPAVIPAVLLTRRGASNELLASWSTTATEWRNQNKQKFTAYCPPGGRAYTVWGSGVHTDDSSICTAAVHSLVTFSFQNGGSVQFETLDGREAYGAKDRNGVATQSYGQWDGSFRILSGVSGKRPQEISDSTEIEITWATTGQQLRGRALQRVRCAAQGDLQPIWGSDSYSENSSVCTAAVHAGLIGVGSGGAISLVAGNTQPSFAATTRSGVSSLPLTGSVGSFTLRK